MDLSLYKLIMKNHVIPKLYLECLKVQYLDPNLFNLCINDICNTSNLWKFADDTNIFYSHQDINVLLNTINYELQKLNAWFAVNKISVNTNNALFMLFFNRENSLHCTVRINNIEIGRLYYT